MTLPNDLDIWKQLVEAKYLKKARNFSEHRRCQSCESPKACFNYYCLLCKAGGLCPTAFQENGPHALHPWLQVRRQTGFEAVAAKELDHFITSVNHIHKSSLNELDLCYLACRIKEEEKRPPGSIEDLKRCEICNYAIPNSKCSKEDFLVCSVECLRRMAQRHPNLNLLRMKDGAMNDMQRPKTAHEKLRKEPTAVAAPATAGRGKRKPSGSEPARTTKRKPGRPAKAQKVETGTRRRYLGVGAVERSISRTASDSDEDEQCRASESEEDEDEQYSEASASDEDEDEQYMGASESDEDEQYSGASESDEDEEEQYMGASESDEDEEYSGASERDEDEEYRGRGRARESDEDEDEQYLGRQRASDSDEDEDEQFMDRQRPATMVVTRDPVWERLERSDSLEEVGKASGASANARKRGKASASARQRRKVSGASVTARQENRSGDEEYSCKGLDILCEIFGVGDEGKGKKHADEDDD